MTAMLSVGQASVKRWVKCPAQLDHVIFFVLLERVLKFDWLMPSSSKRVEAVLGVRIPAGIAAHHATIFKGIFHITQFALRMLRNTTPQAGYKVKTVIPQLPDYNGLGIQNKPATPVQCGRGFLIGSISTYLYSIQDIIR